MKPTEHQLQRSLCIWLDGDPHPVTKAPRRPVPLLPDALYWHTPNGGARSAIEGKRFKEIGARAGIPDLFFLHRSRLFGLELKVPPNKPAPDQLAIRDRLVAGGAEWAWADSLDGAKAWIRHWGLVLC